MRVLPSTALLTALRYQDRQSGQSLIFEGLETNKTERKERQINFFCSDQVEDDEQRNESPEETSPWHRKRGIIRKERETANRRKKTLIFSPLADDDKAYLPHFCI